MKLDGRKMAQAKEATERGAAAMARFVGRDNAKRARATVERIKQNRRTK